MRYSAFRALARMGLLSSAIALLMASLSGPLHAEEPYNIQVVISLTGALAFAGHDEADALQTLEKVVNQKGGVRGRQIHFVIQDDQSNTVVGLQLVNDLIAKNVPLILGPVNTAACLAIAPLLSNGPVLYCFSPQVHSAPGSYMFSSSISSVDIAAADIRYLRLRGWTKIAVVATTDAAGQDGDAAIDEVLAHPENKGIMTVVDREHFAPSDISVAAEMSRVKASGAQAIFAYAVGTPLGTVLRGAYEGGLNLPVITPAANFNYKQLDSYASFQPNNLYMGLAAYSALNALPRGPLKEQVEIFLNSLKAAGLRPAQPQISAWDPGLVTIAALRALGMNASAAQIRSFISNLRGFAGIQGIYDYEKFPQRGVGGDWVFVCRWDPAKDKMVPVSKAQGIP